MWLSGDAGANSPEGSPTDGRLDDEVRTVNIDLAGTTAWCPSRRKNLRSKRNVGGCAE